MKILVATEGSEFSEEAIQRSCLIFANSKGTEIRLIAVYEPTVVPAEPYALSPEYIQAADSAAKKHAEDILTHAVSEIQTQFEPFLPTISTTVVCGSPERSIVEEAESWGADLIVTGSHGRGFWKRTWLGSVSNAIVHHAPCSVMVIRKKD
jgi:nucleotide-binding universal stress UspA family protein